MARLSAPPVNERLLRYIENSLCGRCSGPQRGSQETDQALQLCAGWPGTAILIDEAAAVPSMAKPAGEVIGLPTSAAVTWVAIPPASVRTFADLLSDSQST